MKRQPHFPSRSAALFLAALWLSGPLALPAQPDTAAFPTSTPATMAKSPVESFRKLLVMPADVRQKLLAKQSEQSRLRILEKVHEYEALPTEERDARLKATELSWYLTQLLSTPPTNRTAQLALIPLPKRALVESRLLVLDRVRMAAKQNLRTNQAINLLSRVEPQPPPLSPAAEESRLKLKARIDQLVKLRAAEKTKVLRVMPDAERHRMEKTLQTFEQLPTDKRERCIQSFAKFASMSILEQQEFLRNAQQWSQLSDAERQSWRELVGQISGQTPPAAAPVGPKGGA